MKTRCSKLMVFLFFVMLFSSGCGTQPERPTKVYTTKQYAEFTEYKEFESDLYNERYLGKNYKMKLFYNSTMEPNAARLQSIVRGATEDKILVLTYLKGKPMKPYIVYLSKDYRDLIISMKYGDPITVYGTMLGKINLMHFNCDKFVKGHE